VQLSCSSVPGFSVEPPPNNSLQATTPAAFTSARFARLRFGLRVLRLSSMPFGDAVIVQDP
jgi:hypothetical protein